MLVSRTPGLIVITLIFVFQSSILRASDIASNACFDAEYAPIRGSDINPAIELTFTILPPISFLCSIINGNTCLVNSKRPKKCLFQRKFLYYLLGQGYRTP